MNKLFIKYLLGSISKEEIDVMQKNVVEPKAKSKLKANYRINYLINLLFVKTDIDGAYKRTTKKIIFRKSRRHKLMSTLKYASVFIVLIGLSWFFKDDILTRSNDNTSVIPKVENITLKLNNGEILILDTSEIKGISDNKGRVISYQNANRLDYTSVNNGVDKNFNTLYIPNGKRFSLILSDSTLVHLNSGSSIKYPETFSDKNNRQVYISGEAYLDVYPDKQKPFIVNTYNSSINVLGTEFNVNAFPEDEMTEVVLVEGSVSFQQKNNVDNSLVLKPSQKATLNNNSEHIEIKTVKTSLYTSWMDDKLVFRNVPFKHIIEELERHYSITIVNNNEALADDLFNASFEPTSIENILDFFKEFYGINYIIRDNKIIIE